MEEFFGDFLEQHFQMIYLDQRGVGRSGSPKNHNYSMDRMIKDFEEVRQSLGINQWLTLGHSFGGILQMGYVLGKPNAISGMIFINCSLSLNENGDQSEEILEVSDYWFDYSRLSQDVDQAVLFYYGTSDWAIGPEHYKAAAFPDMLLWESKVGHMPFLENKPDLEKAINCYIQRMK